MTSVDVSASSNAHWAVPRFFGAIRSCAFIESKLEWRGDDIYGCPLDGGEMAKLDHNALVSMNMFLRPRLRIS